MKKLKMLFFNSLMVILFFSCTPGNENKGLGNEIIHGLRPAVYTSERQVTYDLEERMEYWNVPAVSLVVVDGMQIVYSGAFGVKRMGDTTRINENTLFQAASVSKPVAAVGAMTLVHQNELDLDTDINQLLQGWQLPHEAFEQKITLRNILSHSAGLNVGGFAGYPSEESLPGLLEIIEGRPPANSHAVRVVAEPGTKFMYSGGGYQIMQKIMEDVTKKPFPKIMEENVFNPLNMTNSHYAPLDSAEKINAAYGHFTEEHIPNYGPIHVESAAGGLWTTPTDLGNLLIDLMKAYTHQESKILDPETLHLIMKPVFWEYGFGFKVVGEGQNFRFSHGGATTGWHAHFLAFPERGQAVVVMTNGTNGWVLWPEIERSVANILGWPILEPKYIETIELTEDEIKGYTGEYIMNGLNIQITSDSLGLNFEGAGLKWYLIPSKKDTLEIVDMEGQVFFRRDENLAVTGMHLWFGEPDWSPYRSWDFIKSDHQSGLVP
ncbi:MAG: serine hydrolase domain-containing protein [Bacteroides sp.]|jgi:CubicO group peptidase (beta-lactamase class C family)|nr:serine hydrolase domain-containing protein [Bacteroides sp.]